MKHWLLGLVFVFLCASCSQETESTAETESITNAPSTTTARVVDYGSFTVTLVVTDRKQFAIAHSKVGDAIGITEITTHNWSLPPKTQ